MTRPGLLFLTKPFYLINKVQLDSAGRLIDKSIAALAHTGRVDLRNDFILLKSRVLIKSNKLKESIENSVQVLQSAEFSNDTLWQVRSKIFIGWGYMELSQDEQARKMVFGSSEPRQGFRIQIQPAIFIRQPYFYLCQFAQTGFR